MACTQKQNQDFNLFKLPPNSYEFKVHDNTNRIDYFYLDGIFKYDIDGYRKIEKKIGESISTKDMNRYHLYPIYIYNKTDLLNDGYTNGKEGLDGHNNELITYIRYKDGKPDIFYIVKNGNVIFDGIKNEKANFEFDQ